MLPFVAGARRAVQQTARSAAFWAVAGVAGAIALGFFTAALTIWLATHWGGALAALAVGGLYLIVAGVAAVMARPSPQPEPEPVTPGQAWTALAEAFLVGIAAGRGGRK